jgi:glycosyltransferase involved in cell wall biosynthesis
MNPLVSVIIPTHDRPDLVLRAVKSALNQTYKNIEIIVIDDVGNAPAEELKKLNVHYLLIPHTYWIAACRNAGLNFSRGKYIALLDDDDVWFEDYLETLIPIMESNPFIGLACTNGYYINNLDEKPTRLLCPHLKHEMKGNLFAKIIWDCFVLPSLSVFRKDMLTEIGNFKNIRGEDLDVIMRVAAFSYVYYTPKPCGIWYRRINTDGSSKNGASQHQQATLQGRLNLLYPALDCLNDIEQMAKKYGRTFSYTEKFSLYFQKYYFWFYIVAVYFMFKDKERYAMLKEGIKLYPFMIPMTLLAPLCQIKFIRDMGQNIKRRLI